MHTNCGRSWLNCSAREYCDLETAYAHAHACYAPFRNRGNCFRVVFRGNRTAHSGRKQGNTRETMGKSGNKQKRNEQKRKEKIKVEPEPERVRVGTTWSALGGPQGTVYNATKCLHQYTYIQMCVSVCVWSIFGTGKSFINQFDFTVR